MKKIIDIARNEFHLLFRSRTGWGVIFLTVIIAIFMFMFARSDGTLLNELQIRTRYSLYFSTGLLNLILMYLACISLRKEIDTRRFHTIAAAPVHRFQIWLGKFLGLLTFGTLAFLASSLAIGICSGYKIYSWQKPSEVKQIKTAFLRSYFSVSPERPSLHHQVTRQYEKLELEGRLPENKPVWEIRKELFDKLRKKEQMLQPDEQKTWRFKWSTASLPGKHIILKTKFYAENKKKKVTGHWQLRAPNSSSSWDAEFSGYPYQFHEIKIPVSSVPRAKQLILTFKGENSSYLVFPRSNGIALLYDNGSIFKNYIILLIFTLCHFAALLAVSLTLCSFFSYSVAIFVNIVVYALGCTSGFFSNVIRDLSWEAEMGGEHGIISLFTVFIHIGLWLSKGLKAPPVIDFFTEGTAIPVFRLIQDWGIGFVIYTIIIAILGMIVLTRKEIDKELHT